MLDWTLIIVALGAGSFMIYIGLRPDNVSYSRIHSTIAKAIADYQHHSDAGGEMMRELLGETAKDEATAIMDALRSAGLMRFVRAAPTTKLCPHERDWDDCPECNH